MRVDIVGWPPDVAPVYLDYRQFSYAGKFVQSAVGKALLRDKSRERDPPCSPPDTSITYETDVIAAVSFSSHRQVPHRLCYRYITVRHDQRGNQFGPKLAVDIAERASQRGYETLQVAVNNSFAFEAMYRAGFSYTGETTGIAELILRRPTERSAQTSKERYQSGLDRYRNRDSLSTDESNFLASRKESEPPSPLSSTEYSSHS
jgi:hypothetical protein